MSENQAAVGIRERVEQLYSEIIQIYGQYKKEVPKKRRPWPESIKSRVAELWKMGVSSHQIAKETGLPTQTMYSWRQRLKKQSPNFLPVPIVKMRKRRSNFDIQLSQLESEVKSPTVTVVVSDSEVRIENMPLTEAVALVGRFRK